MSFFTAIKDAIFGKANEAPPAAEAIAAHVATEAAPQPVDVEAILTMAASSVDYPTNWRESIVDVMKLCGLDSSLANRKELAAELGFTGDMNDSASMNIWLHKQVMSQLAANGGHVPASLKG